MFLIVDIDECKQNENLCPKENQHCENTEGNYECVCDKEFKLNNDTKECEPKGQIISRTDYCAKN